MGPAWAQVHLTGDLWLPLLWLLLSQVCCFHGLPGWRFTSSEVVIPRKVSHKVSGAGVQDQLSYKIHFRGRRHVVHMKVKKNLLPRNFPVITNNDQGAMQEDYPFVPRNCYYYSYLEGVPGSMGTLDTCYGGLRGMLQVDDFTYEIKPLEASSKFEHVVSQLVSEKRASETERCQIEAEDASVADEELLAELPRAGPVYFWWPHWRRLKIQYTITNSLVVKDTNHTHILDNVVILNSIMHSIYYHNRLEVTVRMLCIWDSSDSVSMEGWKTVNEAIREFGLWKYWDYFAEYPHDTSLLLTGHKISQSTYFTNLNGVCSPNWGVAYVFVADYHIFLAATIAAHCLGHHLGIEHDKPGCRCFRRENCVMAPEPGLLDMLSNCSYELLHRRIFGVDSCLGKIYRTYKNFPYQNVRCGDNRVSAAEECDCGSLKQCAQDKCCETHCALSLGSDCNGGPCCRNCKYAPPGLICRHISGACDLPEYCSGLSSNCPDDFYLLDGTPCSAVAICRRGNCSDRDMQCQSLFGLKAKDASPVCYKILNRRGDRFGNCGVMMYRTGGKPRKCDPEHIFCGLLHCGGVDHIPGGGEHHTFRHITVVENVKKEICFGYDIHFGSPVPPIGLVADGARCGPGKFCIYNRCIYHDHFPYYERSRRCNVSTCNFRGVCNFMGQCHCQRGWKPPDCVEKGTGGSVNSGPPPDVERLLRAKVILDVDKALGLVFLRFILLVLSVVAGALLYMGFVITTTHDVKVKNRHKPK